MEVFYIGIGVTVRRAYQFGKRHRNSDWHRYVDKCGAPVVVIIAENLTRDDAAKHERLLIAHHGLNRLTNKSPGGDSIIGFIPDETTRRKLSDANKGERNPNYGKAMSETITTLRRATINQVVCGPT